MTFAKSDAEGLKCEVVVAESEITRDSSHVARTSYLGPGFRLRYKHKHKHRYEHKHRYKHKHRYRYKLA